MKKTAGVTYGWIERLAAFSCAVVANRKVQTFLCVFIVAWAVVAPAAWFVWMVFGTSPRHARLAERSVQQSYEVAAHGDLEELSSRLRRPLREAENRYGRIRSFRVLDARKFILNVYRVRVRVVRERAETLEICRATADTAETTGEDYSHVDDHEVESVLRGPA